MPVTRYKLTIEFEGEVVEIDLDQETDIPIKRIIETHILRLGEKGKIKSWKCEIYWKDF